MAPELELKGVRPMNNGAVFTTPIHAEIVMEAKKSFTAGEISVKGYYHVQREGATVLHDVIFDEVLAAIPMGQVAIQLVTTPVTYHSLPIYRILGPATAYFVFSRSNEEIMRCVCDVHLNFEGPIVVGEPLPRIVRQLAKKP